MKIKCDFFLPFHLSLPHVPHSRQSLPLSRSVVRLKNIHHSYHAIIGDDDIEKKKVWWEYFSVSFFLLFRHFVSGSSSRARKEKKHFQSVASWQSVKKACRQRKIELREWEKISQHFPHFSSSPFFFLIASALHSVLPIQHVYFKVLINFSKS